MKGYYAIDYDSTAPSLDGIHKSPAIDIPTGLSEDEAVTYVYGEMMLQRWTLDTPHAIYLTKIYKDNYQFVAGDEDVAEKVAAGHVGDTGREGVGG